MAAATTKRKPQPKTRKPSGNGKPRQPVGRPPTYHPAMAEEARRLCEFGATDAQLADFFKVNVSTIWSWQTKHPEFSDALKMGKAPANERLKRSLYQRAVGYSFDAEKIFMPAGAEEPVRVAYREHVPPDPTSGIFMLKNRLPEEFRDRREFDVRTAESPELEERRKRVLDAVLSRIEDRTTRQMITVSPQKASK